MFEGEIKEFILETLEEELNENISPRDRIILEDIIKNNNFNKILESRREEIRRIFKGYKKINSSKIKTLDKLGFKLCDDEKHYKFEYYNDGRYSVTAARTSSDYKEPKNLKADFIRRAF